MEPEKILTALIAITGIAVTVIGIVVANNRSKQIERNQLAATALVAHEKIITDIASLRSDQNRLWDIIEGSLLKQFVRDNDGHAKRR